MSHNQSLLTNFFKSGKGPGDVSNLKVKQERVQEESIVIISSDEENCEDSKIKDMPGNSVDSETSDCTIVYTPESPRKRLKNSFAFESPEITVKDELPSHSKRSASPVASAEFTHHSAKGTVTPCKSNTKINPNVTPQSKQSTGNAKETPSPSKKAKFFSPNKQRNIEMKTNKGQKKLFEFMTSKEDIRYTTACDGVDDKSTYLDFGYTIYLSYYIIIIIGSY